MNDLAHVLPFLIALVVMVCLIIGILWHSYSRDPDMDRSTTAGVPRKRPSERMTMKIKGKKVRLLIECRRCGRVVLAEPDPEARCYTICDCCMDSKNRTPRQ